MNTGKSWYPLPMNLTFRLRFATQPGQSLWLTGDAPLPSQLPLHFLDRESWQATIPLTGAAVKTALNNYAYLLRNADGSFVADWGRDRQLIPADFAGEELLIIDTWNAPGSVENVFYAEPFRNVLLVDNFTEVETVAPKDPTHTFRIKAPLLARGQTLCLIGEGHDWGNWQTHAPILLRRSASDTHFQVRLDLRRQTFPFAYKYGVFDVEKKSFVRFEDGANRILNDRVAAQKYTIVNDGFAALPANTWRGTGVAVPVFSLRSADSFGVGEFLDLKLLADWGKKVGLKLIQLLPVNDTQATHTWHDSYPYAAISAFALHPIYLNLAAVVSAKNRSLLKKLEAERQRLNALAAVDYEAVLRAKLDFLKQIFPSQKAATFRSREYKTFLAGNGHWLMPYAVFCFLRDKFGTPDFSQWPEHQTFSAKNSADLAKDNNEVAFHCFLQFHLHQQLLAATAHAHAAGLMVKGDIAIGVFRHGADAWQSPELFNMELQAGAPPDAFAAKGQNWGFPTYNWPRMAADGFAWWKQRFAQMAHYFDAFRIDHILGFFRIWSSPAHAVEGILGYFVPAIPLTEEEFSSRGIFFNHTRFTQPFINDAVVQDIFGDDAAFVRREFLDANGGGLYSLKPPFATQRQVAEYFAARRAAGNPSDAKGQGLAIDQA
ncbi:MAG TPA: 4-alpha-glucanotransferase, partial [Verrucomicrobiae bacterium]